MTRTRRTTWGVPLVLAALVAAGALTVGTAIAADEIRDRDQVQDTDPIHDQDQDRDRDRLREAGPAARLDGQLGRLERRLAEAASASNPDAVAAALEAYERIAAEVSTMVPPAGSDEVRVQARITEQLRSLQGIGGGNGRGVRAATRSANGLLLWLGAGEGGVPAPDASASPVPSQGSTGGSALPTADGSPTPSSPWPDPHGSPGGNGGPNDPGPTSPPHRERR